ncbi:MAG: GntR family transcriptional regulator, partial [Planctomycetaceae bacterium]|nr:GntR family transcriptional regulator [Planctomycetaceae bacterium]
MAKHQDIFETLLREIESGRYGTGGRLPTELALVKRFNASRPTVSRALHELVRMGLVHRRAGSGTFVRTRTGSGRMVFGLLVPELGDSEIFEPICGHIARIIQRQGHALQWADTAPSAHHRQTADNAADACRGLIERGVAGVFLAPFVTPPETENPNTLIVQTLRRAGIAIVLLDRDIVPFPARSDLDLVAVDHLRGQARITEFLVTQGYRRFGFWLWKNAADTLQQRAAGVLRISTNAGITLDPEFIQACDPDDAEQVARLMRMQRPDVVMCANDVFAGRLLKTLEGLGMRVPQDVAVVGYDDVRYAHLMRVPLTTISQPCEQIGRAAAQLMQERLANPDLPSREV